MPSPRSFVVKVYRQRADALAGTVQDVRTGRTVPFQSMEELWQALGRPSPVSGKRGAEAMRPSTPSPEERNADHDK
ncbi:MAG: hypothetical protein IT532_09425 [Burkholderiales bacterium]|nr:hypothetical protein [Burkholderiales bacterium]